MANDFNKIHHNNAQFWLKIAELKQKINELTKECERERKDKEAMKSQATSLEKEYDRLTEEYSKLQKRLTVSGSYADKDDQTAHGVLRCITSEESQQCSVTLEN